MALKARTRICAGCKSATAANKNCPHLVRMVREANDLMAEKFCIEMARFRCESGRPKKRLR